MDDITAIENAEIAMFNRLHTLRRKRRISRKELLDTMKLESETREPDQITAFMKTPQWVDSVVADSTQIDMHQEYAAVQTGPTEHLNKSVISEYVVALDLLRRGFDVYSTVSMVAIASIVAIHRNSGTVYTFQVRTGTLNTKTGRVTATNRRGSKCDILAAVSGNGVITYTPELP